MPKLTMHSQPQIYIFINEKKMRRNHFRYSKSNQSFGMTYEIYIYLTSDLKDQSSV